MTIGRILEGRTARIVTCEAGLSVTDAIDILGQHRIGALPVVEAGSVVGIFSERDVIYKLRELGPRALALTVRDAMTAPAVTVNVKTGADDFYPIERGQLARWDGKTWVLQGKIFGR